MIKKILIALLSVIGGICLFAALKSGDFAVTRSAVIAAPPEAVFKIANDMRRWGEWSPWSKLDPAMKSSQEGPPEGAGAIYHWEGNMEVGKGTMRVTESKPSERIGMKLEFKEPMAGDGDVVFAFAPEGAGTKVSWSMSTKQPFMGRLMGIFMNMEKMTSDAFDEGLANLGKLATAPAAPATPAVPATPPTP